MGGSDQRHLDGELLIQRTVGEGSLRLESLDLFLLQDGTNY